MFEMDQSRTISLSSEQRMLFDVFMKQLGQDTVNRTITISANETVPASIFSSRLSPLESLTTYLKGKGFRVVEIARKLNRDERTIWLTLKKAKNKRARLDSSSEYTIPLSLFTDRTKSVMELAVEHLHSSLRLSEIAKLLNKSPSTINTSYRRALAKGAGR